MLEKKVNINSISMDGVDSRDYPDFCDAFIDYAEYEDGTELNEDELEDFQNENPELVYELAFESFLWVTNKH